MKRLICPLLVLVFGELPKIATGKIQKYKLREQEWGKNKTRVA